MSERASMCYGCGLLFAYRVLPGANWKLAWLVWTKYDNEHELCNNVDFALHIGASRF